MCQQTLDCVTVSFAWMHIGASSTGASFNRLPRRSGSQGKREAQPEQVQAGVMGGGVLSRCTRAQSENLGAQVVVSFNQAGFGILHLRLPTSFFSVTESNQLSPDLTCCITPETRISTRYPLLQAKHS